MASAAFFAWELWQTRGEAWMLFGVFLLPFAVAAALALASSWGLRNTRLRVLGGLTLVTGVLVYGGVLGTLAGAGLIAYVGLAAAMVGYGWRDWGAA